jgi:hypothetical protein
VLLHESRTDLRQLDYGVTFPAVGRWYRRLDGNLFEVVAVDEHQNTVELQHFDGTIEGMEMEVWMDTKMEPAEAPEDWSGSVDVDREDLLETSTSSKTDWQHALEFIDRIE